MAKQALAVVLTAFCLAGRGCAWTLPTTRPSTTRAHRSSYPLFSSLTAKDKTQEVTQEKPKFASETYTEQEWEQLVADHAWAYSNTPPTACTSYECDSIEGKVPSDLSGTLYRNGPGNFERQGQRYNHVLDGDGFVAAFFFKNGKVHYTGRFVETEYYKQECEEDKILYRNVFGTQPPGGVLTNAFDVDLKNVANTNIMQWGGRLFAFWEGGRPYELDPATLKTLKADPNLSLLKGLGRPNPTWRGITIDEGGPVDATLNLGRMFTAHPHVWRNQTLVGYRSALNPTDDIRKIEFVEYDQDWNERITAKYDLPKAPSASHDFAMSQDYYCFFENRLGLDLPPFIVGLKSCAEVMALSLKEPTILHLVPRTSDKKALQFEVPPYFNIHMAPTVLEEENNRLIIYHNGWNLEDERFFPIDSDTSPFLGEWGGQQPCVDKTPGAHLYRTVIDLDTERLVDHSQIMPGLVMEFLAEDPQSPQHLYMGVSSTDNISKPFDGIGKMDSQTNKLECWWAEPRVFVGEPVVVPKTAGGVWILALLHDAINKRASLAVLDGNNIEQGPVCRIHLKHHLTLGLHGSFS